MIAKLMMIAILAACQGMPDMCRILAAIAVRIMENDIVDFKLDVLYPVLWVVLAKFLNAKNSNAW
jgi:hypothetical protein